MKTNLLYEFDIQELMLIHQSLTAVLQLASHDESAPNGLVEATQSTINKIESIVEQRIANDNNFTELVVASLSDVENYSKEVIKQETENK